MKCEGCWFAYPSIDMSVAMDYLRFPSAMSWVDRYGLADLMHSSNMPPEVLKFLKVDVPVQHLWDWQPLPLETILEATDAESEAKKAALPSTPNLELA